MRKAPVLSEDSDGHADTIRLQWTSIQKGQAGPLSPPPRLCTNLKNRGWCSKLFSSKTRRLSLCSCSILCFCTSASSMFPSSRSLGIEGEREKEQSLEKQPPATSMPEAGYSRSPAPRPFVNPWCSPLGCMTFFEHVIFSGFRDSIQRNPSQSSASPTLPWQAAPLCLFPGYVLFKYKYVFIFCPPFWEHSWWQNCSAALYFLLSNTSQRASCRRARTSSFSIAV